MSELVEIDVPSVSAMAVRLRLAAAAMSQVPGVLVPTSNPLRRCTDGFRALADCAARANDHLREAEGAVGLAGTLAAMQAVNADRFGPGS